MKRLLTLCLLWPCMVFGAGTTPIIPNGTVLGNSSGAAAPASPLTTLPSAVEPAHTGDMTNTAGSLTTTVSKLNGTTPGGTCTNQSVTSVSASAVPACTTLTSAYVDTSIAQTGVDINASNQVTVTHLAAPLPATQGGTGQTTITLGDLFYGSASNVLNKLAGNTSATKQFLTQTGNGSVSAAPAWGTLVTGDIPNLGANPTASAGLTAVNGSATTYLRSDGAPALDQTVAPTWTGVHLFSSAEPRIRFSETDQGSDLKGWDLDINAGSLCIRTRTDADGAGTSPFCITRSSGNISGSAQINATTSLSAGSSISGQRLSLSVNGSIPAVGVYSDTSNELDFSTNTTKRGKFDSNGNLAQNTAFISLGTKPTVTGCSNSSTLGGAVAGSYLSGTTGTCSVTITLPTGPTNGYACFAHDDTTAADYTQSSIVTSVTTLTISGTTVSGDKIVWGCPLGY